MRTSHQLWTMTSILSLSILGLTIVSLSVFSSNALADTSSLNSSLVEQAKQAVVEEDLKSAKDIIEDAIAASPSDGMAFKIAGDIYSLQALRASLFSAPGLAKKALKSYKKAVTLEPDKPRNRLALMQFYLAAPGIVGGDKELGAEQAKMIKTLDPVQGVIADAILYQMIEDQEAYQNLFKTLDETLMQEPQVKLEHAQYFANIDQADKALALLTDLSSINPKALTDKTDSLVPFKALLQIGFLGLKDDSYLTKGQAAIMQYLDQAPRTYHLTSHQWAGFFLGQTYQKLGNTELAKQTYEQVKRETKDKHLLKELKSSIKELD